MNQLKRDTAFDLPIKFMQFGEGNFLRAFVDWQIDLLNEKSGLNAGVVVVRPISRNDFPLLDAQGGVYTTLIRGLNEAGEAVKEYRKITCIQREIDIASKFDEYLALAHNPDLRFIVSNTTEAGITTNTTDQYTDVPQVAFPAKLTRFLHGRFSYFGGAVDKGLVLLPCELIDYNGTALKDAVMHFSKLWKLGDAFEGWLETACTFCSTLVDRIVTGYPRDEIAQVEAELGYTDQFLVTAEYFYLFVIQGPAWLADELKLSNAGLNIKLVDDISLYKQRKVGVLNGGHTVMVPVGLLAGLETVGQAVEDSDVGGFLLKVLDEEIIPALPLPRSELDPFAADVLLRFKNPFIKHRMESIALNSWSKYAARVLPQLLRSIDQGNLPKRLILSLAATMILYKGRLIKLSDNAEYIEWFADAWAKHDSGALSLAEMSKRWLAYSALWGRDLTSVSGLVDALSKSLAEIEAKGMRAALAAI